VNTSLTWRHVRDDSVRQGQESPATEFVPEQTVPHALDVRDRWHVHDTVLNGGVVSEVLLHDELEAPRIEHVERHSVHALNLRKQHARHKDVVDPEGGSAHGGTVELCHEVDGQGERQACAVDGVVFPTWKHVLVDTPLAATRLAAYTHNRHG